MSQKIKASAISIVWMHIIIAILHGLAHAGIHVWQPVLDDVFLVLTILILPVGALWLLKAGYNRSGMAMLLICMGSALVYGLWHHFLTPGVDNVASILPGFWQFPFQLTSFLLFIVEASGCAIALRGLIVAYNNTHAWQQSRPEMTRKK